MTESSLSQTQKGVSLEVIAKDAAVALIIKASGLVLIYVMQIFLARWMGRTEYGIYEYVVAWSLFLAIPAGLGLPRTSMRLISEYRVKQDWGSLRGILRGSWLLTMVVSTLLCLGVAGIILLLNHYHSFVYATPMLIAMGLIPLQALVQLQLETTRAMNDIALAYAPYQVIWPVLVLCGGLIILQKNHSLTSLPMIEVATVMLLVVVVSQSWLLREKVDREIEPASPVYDYRTWIGISVILLIQRTFLTILDETDIIMVGSLIGPAAAGMYNAAAKTALWVSFVLEIMVMVAGPAFVTLYTQGDMEGLQKVVSRVTIWIFWPSAVIGVCLLAFTQPVLSIFGRDFMAASLSLKVLILGRLVDSLCGTVACLMVMTGNQNKSLPVFGCSALINLVLNAIAIPRFGMLGAAMTTTFTLVI
ncbi:MAG: oligosaccharide flippase family protein [Moorea sp. SIO4E2]|uniref:lipopolysaccharide biosynthesis protein n=1 Tax=Moorena sp. SIO4E2 TaxID=2607826 RepID=UPI0013BD32A2|nr:oligosaccharide flippase family protein [Moorena sp. SIO4E2]NEQ10362.1 oligosaccharide flippase family protein [Moorena sp. SIO4E2]